MLSSLQFMEGVLTIVGIYTSCTSANFILSTSSSSLSINSNSFADSRHSSTKKLAIFYACKIADLEWSINKWLSSPNANYI